MTPDEFKGHTPAPLLVSESLDARASNRMLDITSPDTIGQPLNDAETMRQGAAAIRDLLSANIKLREALELMLAMYSFASFHGVGIRIDDEWVSPSDALAIARTTLAKD
jgi:hypothetical protein